MTLALCRYTDTRAGVGHWIPSLPSHWSVKPVKRVFAEVNERSKDGSEELLSVSEYFGVKPRREAFSEDEHLSRAESLEGYKKCRPGDLVMNIMLAWKTGLGVSGFDGIVSPAYSVFRLRERGIPRYFHYLLRSPEYVRYFKAYSSGVIDSRLRLYPDVFGSLGLVVPSEEEQNSIARFLDYETARIDELIAKQERLIELLKEKRQAVISHAVTKGLNPDAPMKDFGVEWLGEVPAQWSVKQYRYATRVLRGKFGHRPRNDPALYDGPHPFIQTGDVAQAEKYVSRYKQTLNDLGASVSAKFPAGTLVMAIAANVGDTAILEFDAYAPDSVVGFKPVAKTDVEFLRYSFIAALQALQANATQSAQANLNIDRIGSLHATFPSREEQREIVGYLDGILRSYQSLIARASTAIDLLQERRSALISAAVTGKIDVRDWQPPENNKAA